MAYRYAAERADHSDLASGQVLRSAPGYPGFPVRLADELFQRALAHLPGDPVRMWDPCCGSGYLGTVLGLLHRDRLAHVLTSDISADAVGLARRNLALLSERGLAERGQELRARAERFGKPAYAETAAAADRLRRRLRRLGGNLPHTTAVGDAFTPAAPASPVDLVLTDVPYGELTRWGGAAPSGAGPDAAIPALLAALAGVLPGHAVLVVTARARRIPLPAGVRPLEWVRVGNRAAVLSRAADLR